MGSELVSSSLSNEGSESKGSAALSRIETFWEYLPFYLSIGMSTDEYWNGDCRLTESYRKADEMKRRRRNEELWLQGMYVYHAVCDVSPVLNAFAKKGTKPAPYATEPFPITPKQLAEKKERDERFKAEQTKSKLLAWAARTNAQMNARAEKGGK